MKEIDHILAHPIFLREMKRINRLEEERIYCRHGIDHLLAVARIAWIGTLEEDFSVKKEEIYAAALLHDIGRGAQYETGEPHDEAGVRLAGEILAESGFSREAKERILEAVGDHRSRETKEAPLAELIRRADKQSRDCYLCPARETCKWPEEKKNKTVSA